MVVLSYSVIYYIYIPGTLGPCFHYWCSIYGISQWSDTLVVFVCLQITPSHYHHYADLSEGIELLKCLVRYMMPSVCLRLRQLSQLPLFIRWGCVSSVLPDYPAMIVIMCTLSYYHHQIGSMNHLPLFRVKSWNNGMRCMSYYVLVFFRNLNDIIV